VAQVVDTLFYEIGGLGVRFPIVSLGCSVDLIHLAALLPLGLTQVVIEISTTGYLLEGGVEGKGGRYVGLTTFPHSFVDFQEILEPSTSCSP